MKKIFFSLVLLSFLAMPAMILAVEPQSIPTPTPPGFQTVNPPAAKNVEQIFGIVNKGLAYFAGIIFIVAVGILLYAGLLFMTSAGDEGKVTTAKNYLIYAIVGGVVAALAWSATAIIDSLIK